MEDTVIWSHVDDAADVGAPDDLYDDGEGDLTSVYASPVRSPAHWMQMAAALPATPTPKASSSRAGAQPGRWMGGASVAAPASHGTQSASAVAPVPLSLAPPATGSKPAPPPPPVPSAAVVASSVMAAATTGMTLAELAALDDQALLGLDDHDAHQQSLDDFIHDDLLAFDDS